MREQLVRKPRLGIGLGRVLHSASPLHPLIPGHCRKRGKASLDPTREGRSDCGTGSSVDVWVRLPQHGGIVSRSFPGARSSPSYDRTPSRPPLSGAQGKLLSLRSLTGMTVTYAICVHTPWVTAPCLSRGERMPLRKQALYKARCCFLQIFCHQDSSIHQFLLFRALHLLRRLIDSKLHLPDPFLQLHPKCMPPHPSPSPRSVR